jgi:hypothetical protein
VINVASGRPGTPRCCDGNIWYWNINTQVVNCTVFSGPLGALKKPKMTQNQGVRPKVQCTFSMDEARYNDTEKQNSKMRVYELANRTVKTGQPPSLNSAVNNRHLLVQFLLQFSESTCVFSFVVIICNMLLILFLESSVVSGMITLF